MVSIRKGQSRVLFISHVFTSFIHLITVDILVLQLSIQLFYYLRFLGVSCAVFVCCLLLEGLWIGGVFSVGLCCGDPLGLGTRATPFQRDAIGAL